MVRIMHTYEKSNFDPLFINSDSDLLSNSPPSTTLEAQRHPSQSFIHGAQTGNEERKLEDDIHGGTNSENTSLVIERKRSAPLEDETTTNHKAKYSTRTFKGKMKVQTDGTHEFLIDAEDVADDDQFFHPHSDEVRPVLPSQLQDLLKIMTMFAKEQRTITAAHRVMTRTMMTMMKELERMEAELKRSEDKWSNMETMLRALSSSD